ncbi:MAG: undecaprenyl-diphosphate phosphatase [Candidatus Latescibacteria bacterium]|nr:undecaprenyl-diphosphate phosphatase [Candidatus Latescibacterota bacterium]
MSILFIAVILGIVEGLTEFLPVSSTGHLIVVGHLLGFKGEVADTFDIFIQMGAILAVVVYYRRWLWETTRAALGRASDALSDVRQARRTLLGILLAVLPALVVGAGLHGVIKRHLFQPWTVAVGLMVGGVAIFAVERWRPEARTCDLGRVTLRQAFLIGVGQCLSLWPGVSRAGATILSGLCLGLDHPTAAAFSFLLSIPTLTAAVAYDLLKSWRVLSGGDLAAMGVGFGVSFVVAWGVIAGFLQFLRTHSLRVFGWYRLAVGAVILWLKP